MSTKALLYIFWAFQLSPIGAAVCCDSRSSISKRAQSSPTPQIIVTNNSTSKLIRSVDFANFTYPWVSDFRNPKANFTLKNGELKWSRENMGAILESITYGDVTGDGIEKAMVVLSIITGGSSIPHISYIYEIQGQRPQLLWAFSTGDRADGGLRQLYAEKGELVVERYFLSGDTGLCCANQFKRIHFKWMNNVFQQIGEEEILPNPDPNKSASLIMPPYSINRK